MLTDTATAWVGPLIFDLVVFLLTLWRALHTYKLQHGSLLDIFLRDGELTSSNPSL